jgi:hypothetical protein
VITGVGVFISSSIFLIPQASNVLKCYSRTG